MKPWYKKKKVWAAILGALGPVLTIFLAPDNVETVKVIAAAILQAGIAAGFIFAESSVDKAAAKLDSTTHNVLEALTRGERHAAGEVTAGEVIGTLKPDGSLKPYNCRPGCGDCTSQPVRIGDCACADFNQHDGSCMKDADD